MNERTTCFQKERRDDEAERDPRPQDSTLDYTIGAIDAADAKPFILKYEWLGTVGHPIARYGARNAGGELVAVALFGSPSTICGEKAIRLERGACSHWAHPHTASWFIPKACAMAARDHGWQIFCAYTDADAGEIGTVYQACNWRYIGRGESGKHKYIHLEPSKRTLRKLIAKKYGDLPYPKRAPRRMSRLEERMGITIPGDWEAGYAEGRASLADAYKRLEDRVARLTAQLYGYVNRKATEPPDTLYGAPRPGQEWRKIRRRTAYILNPDGTSWRRVKGQVKRQDYVRKFPPKICENCGELFAPGRADAKTCSDRCRKALQRRG